MPISDHGREEHGDDLLEGEPLKKVPTEQLVDELFAEIERYYAAGRTVVRDEVKAAEARAWLAEHEDDTQLTPERLAASKPRRLRRTASTRSMRTSRRSADAVSRGPSYSPGGNANARCGGT